MNKIVIVFIIILFVVLFNSCSMIIDIYNYSLLPGFPIDRRDFGDITDLRGVSDAVSRLCEYKYEGINNYYQSPTETIERGKGDCDDMVILFLNIAYVELGIKCSMVGVNYEDGSRTVVNGGIVDHFAVGYNGEYFDAKSINRKYNPSDIGYEYKFNEIFIF